MKQLIEDIAKALVNLPEEVSINVIEGEQTTVLELKVAPGDLGKVIGKQGRTARSIRTILGAAGMKLNRRFTLEISLSSTADDWVAVAVLGRPRGNRGELTAESLSSRPERFARLKEVRLMRAGERYQDGEAYHVEEVWEHAGALVFKFRGVDSISGAERLRGAEVQVPRAERIELEPGEYFHSDLIGCEVRERSSGREIGRVTKFEEYGGPPLLEIDGGRMLIPFVKAICVDIRPEEKLIQVDLPEGLENLALP